MILWTIKQLLSLKKALTGRACPSELAWGLAFGLAIGLIPKGNLVSICLIGFVVSLRVNHGMAALAAVGISFAARYLDPLSHTLGVNLLESPQIRQQMDRWWDAPLVPWTDLNNTVVMGSTVIALSAIVPTFVVTLPIFRWLAPRKKAEEVTSTPPPSFALAATTTDVAVQPDRMTPQLSTSTTTAQPIAPIPTIETQIDVIRIRPETETDEADWEAAETAAPHSMNETLGYLLRRLKDTRQQGKAA